MAGVASWLNNDTVSKLERVLKESDEETVMNLVKHFLKPCVARIQKHTPTIIKGTAGIMSVVFLYYRFQGLIQAKRAEMLWKRKIYLSSLSAQLLTTVIDCKERHNVRHVDKRTLFQRDLSHCGMLSDRRTQLMVCKAAERTSIGDPFVTSKLSVSDSWHVLNCLVNELSVMAGVNHLHSMQGRARGARRGQLDWYVIALMNPMYDTAVERHFMGGTVECPVAARSNTLLRLVVVWEKELWNIVCKKIQKSEDGMLSKRHERRYDLLEHMATHYKRYMARNILQEAAETECKREHNQHNVKVSRGRSSSKDSTRSGGGADSLPLNGPFISEGETGGLIFSAISENLANLAKKTGFVSESFEELASREISKENFMVAAENAQVPAQAALQIFEEFDQNHDEMLSLREIEDVMGTRGITPTKNYVDTHLMKVCLPVGQVEDFGRNEPPTPVYDSKQQM